MKNINQMLEMDSTQEMVIESGNQLIYNKSHNPTLHWAKLAAGYASRPIMMHLIKKYLLNRVTYFLPQNYSFVQWGNLNKVHPDLNKKRGIKLDSSEPTCRSHRHFYLRPKHN